ncbi:MAG TPA: class I SAM-dependent rRNA methyltransferase [Polyangia bacterium]|nr:class I SAM-dependent rRNA methyltransferase [Polyangia bacterium]
MAIPQIVLRKGRARPLWFGHPWVYANAVLRIDGQPAPGDLVSLVDHDGRFIGRGFYSPRSQIPVRLCTRAEEAVDAAFFRRRVQQARAARTRLGLPSASTTAYRLINSEGDDLPGLVVDVYGDAAVAQITTLGMANRRAEIFDALEAELGSQTLFEISPPSYAELEGFAPASRVARGAPRSSVSALEDDIALEVEPLSGQKTGMFIDQRETRARVGTLARGARVLDVYAYAGGFSLAAARGGAAAVTAVDSSARAVARIEAHAAANGVKNKIEAIEADAFRFLETATPRAFDLVVIDPPKFARARKDLEAARKGYERLNALAMQAAAAGAVLVTCSCSQNVDAETFERIVAAGAKQAGREVRVFERRGPAADHLLPPGFTEGQYLKVLFCYVV